MPVPLSVVVQGSWANGDEILGVLDCHLDATEPAEAVGLRAGDALVLARARHRPRPVADGEKRLVFVLFFSELNPTG